MSELSIFNNSTSSLDHPSTCSLTIDMDMNDSSMFTCSKMTKDYKSDNLGIKPYADNHSDDRYSFDPHVFDDSDEDVLTMHDYDTGVLSINGRNDNNNNIYDHHHDIDGDDVREELGSPWDLLDDWALIVDTPLRIDDDDNERLFPSTTVDMSFSQQQQQQQQCNCASDDHHPYNYYNNNGHNSSTEQQGSNHHSHNTALMIGSRGNNNYQPMIGININNSHSDCICSSMVPFPIDISPGCKKHSLFAKRTEFQRPMDYYSNNSSVVVHSRNNPQTTHIGRDMETAATLDRSISKRVKSVVPGATVRYKKDGSVAKKIGRPAKKATTINKANKRNNNNNKNNNNNSINIQLDNNSININNSRANYGYRSSFDNNNNNTIIIDTPISMNVSTVSDPVEEQQQQQQQSSGWPSLTLKRSSNYIDSHSRKYTKM